MIPELCGRKMRIGTVKAKAQNGEKLTGLKGQQEGPCDQKEPVLPGTTGDP
jgi:hypothetical protein